MTIDALLSLGGNLGDRRATMEAAIERLAALPATTVTARSPFYRTEPVGPVAQDWFVNLAIALRTNLDAPSLAAACRRIEVDLGRDRSTEIPSGPRPIDIDVIAVGRGGQMEVLGTALDRRAFVIVPLVDIAADIRIGSQTVAEIAGTIDRSGVRRLD